MADKSKIEWCDASWNPIRGCSRVSEGCRHCYAERVAARFSGLGQPYEGLAVMTPSGARWTGEVRLVEEHLEDPLRWKRPRRIFVNSMSDLFHESVPDEWIDRICAVMALAPQHIFQVLTKRPERMRDYMARGRDRIVSHMKSKAAAGVNGWADWTPRVARHKCWIEKFDEHVGFPLPNVWLGVSVEDQKSADERIPLLLQTPAAVRWLSCEPLLGSIDLNSNAIRVDADSYAGQVHWVVVGGESGAGARPMNPEWARALRDECVAAGIPFFFKQWGQWFPVCEAVPEGAAWEIGKEKALTHIHLWRDEAENVSVLVGKKNAGRLLDGREWNDYPRTEASV